MFSNRPCTYRPFSYRPSNTSFRISSWGAGAGFKRQSRNPYSLKKSFLRLQNAYFLFPFAPDFWFENTALGGFPFLTTFLQNTNAWTNWLTSQMEDQGILAAGSCLAHPFLWIDIRYALLFTTLWHQVCCVIFYLWITKETCSLFSL